MIGYKRPTYITSNPRPSFNSQCLRVVVPIHDFVCMSRVQPCSETLSLSNSSALYKAKNALVWVRGVLPCGSTYRNVCLASIKYFMFCICNSNHSLPGSWIWLTAMLLTVMKLRLLCWTRRQLEKTKKWFSSKYGRSKMISKSVWDQCILWIIRGHNYVCMHMYMHVLHACMYMPWARSPASLQYIHALYCCCISTYVYLKLCKCLLTQSFMLTHTYYCITASPIDLYYYCQQPRVSTSVL